MVDGGRRSGSGGVKNVGRKRKWNPNLTHKLCIPKISAERGEREREREGERGEGEGEKEIEEGRKEGEKEEEGGREKEETEKRRGRRRRSSQGIDHLYFVVHDTYIKFSNVIKGKSKIQKIRRKSSGFYIPKAGKIIIGL